MLSLIITLLLTFNNTKHASVFSDLHRYHLIGLLPRGLGIQPTCFYISKFFNKFIFLPFKDVEIYKWTENCQQYLYASTTNCNKKRGSRYQ